MEPGGGNEGDSGNTPSDNPDFSWFDWLKEGFKVLISGITSLLDYLNPLSDKFFVYKLIELLGELLKSLFVPSEERINALIDVVTSKFGFIETIKTAISSLEDVINNIGDSPKISIPIGGTKYNNSFTFVFDMSWYAPFKEYGDLIITGFVYISFLWRLFIKTPSIISGHSGSIEGSE